jgi:hypothetical protein
MTPKRPKTLSVLAERVLEEFRGKPIAENIILGGGIALKHYDDFRSTQDIDAWWKEARNPETITALRSLIENVGKESGYEVVHRQFGVTDSFEFKETASNKKVFSFQISVRDVTLDAPLLSAWPPLYIETLRDNIGSKMNALINRGAPRDLMDIYRIVNDGLLKVEDCWKIWQEKNPSGERDEAQGKVLTHLIRLEQRRPLEAILVQEERQSATMLRKWYHEAFLLP